MSACALWAVRHCECVRRCERQSHRLPPQVAVAGDKRDLLFPALPAAVRALIRIDPVAHFSVLDMARCAHAAHVGRAQRSLAPPLHLSVARRAPSLPSSRCVHRPAPPASTAPSACSPSSPPLWTLAARRPPGTTGGSE